jgi:hypothetical protein
MDVETVEQLPFCIHFDIIVISHREPDSQISNFIFIVRKSEPSAGKFEVGGSIDVIEPKAEDSRAARKKRLQGHGLL